MLAMTRASLCHQTRVADTESVFIPGIIRQDSDSQLACVIAQPQNIPSKYYPVFVLPQKQFILTLLIFSVYL